MGKYDMVIKKVAGGWIQKVRQSYRESKTARNEAKDTEIEIYFLKSRREGIYIHILGSFQFLKWRGGGITQGTI